MIGYRNAETVLNENPSKTLAFEIIKMGRIWILYNLTIDIDELCNSTDVIMLSELVKYFPRKYTIHEYMRLYDYIFSQKGFN